MQITAFKAILARRINIRGCEDYKNTFARMESDCTLRFGFKALINSISYTKHSNLFLTRSKSKWDILKLQFLGNNQSLQ